MSTYFGQGPAPAMMLLTGESGYELRLAAGHSVNVRDVNCLAAQGRTELWRGMPPGHWRGSLLHVIGLDHTAAYREQASRRLIATVGDRHLCV
ncbi:MAG: hypothetical protein WAK86_03320 [Pseudonocardiaceae bacterium]